MGKDYFFMLMCLISCVVALFTSGEIQSFALGFQVACLVAQVSHS
jgi:hypothetical protein